MSLLMGQPWTSLRLETVGRGALTCPRPGCQGPQRRLLPERLEDASLLGALDRYTLGQSASIIPRQGLHTCPRLKDRPLLHRLGAKLELRLLGLRRR